MNESGVWSPRFASGLDHWNVLEPIWTHDSGLPTPDSFLEESFENRIHISQVRVEREDSIDFARGKMR